MAENENGAAPIPTVEELQKGWHDLNLKVRQMDAELTMVEQENKLLRSLLERMIEHRQKSHAEMISILTSLVTKLPINDIGVVVSRLVEHNEHVNEVSSALAKGKKPAVQTRTAIAVQPGSRWASQRGPPAYAERVERSWRTIIVPTQLTKVMV